MVRNSENLNCTIIRPILPVVNVIQTHTPGYRYYKYLRFLYESGRQNDGLEKYIARQV